MDRKGSDQYIKSQKPYYSLISRIQISFSQSLMQEERCSITDVGVFMIVCKQTICMHAWIIPWVRSTTALVSESFAVITADTKSAAAIIN